MACQTQSYQEGAPISHWETIFCSQSSPSRPPVPTSSHPAHNNGDEATPPHLPQPRSQSRPTMVEQLPITLEWHLNVHSTRNGRMQTPSSRTPMPRLPRIWRLPGRCLVKRRLAATPAATQALHTVAGIIRHSGSSSDLGHLLVGQRIKFHCDNLPIVQSWTNQSSRHPGIMDLLTTLFFIAVRNSFLGAPPRQTELHCRRTFPQSKCHASFPLPPRPTSCPRLYLRSWQSSRRPPQTPPA